MKNCFAFLMLALFSTPSLYAVDNGNAFTLEGAQAGSFICHVSIQNFQFSKTFGNAFTIQDGMELLRANFCELLDGYVNEEGTLDISGDCYVASWDGKTWLDTGQASTDDAYFTSSLVLAHWTLFTLASTNASNPMNATADPSPFDLDNSGAHDTGDMLMLLGQFACTTGCSNDLTGDDAADAADLLALLGVFVTPCP